VVPAPTAAELYARAEAALAAGDPVGAEAIWNHLLARYPEASQAAWARYDLARVARARGDRSAAQAHLARLLAGPPPAALAEPAAFLACRLHVEAGAAATAAGCFAGFRARFPASAHDAEVLAWLAGRAFATGGCGAARALSAEYLSRHPRGGFAARARECAEVP
jgi:TolA-binding protein